VTVRNAYDNDSSTRLLLSGQSVSSRWELKSSFGWYDLVVAVDTDQSFLRRLAGHVEDGRDSASDPALGRSGRSDS